MSLPPLLLPSGVTQARLPDGDVIDLPTTYPTFPAWRGSPLSFDFGGKPVLDFSGQAVFAEIFVLRLLEAAGWTGVWTEAFGRGLHFLRDMPSSWRTVEGHNAASVPPDLQKLVESIREKAGTRAFFDVFCWDGTDVLFCECKRSRKDRFTPAQLKFIAAALACGAGATSFLIVEWNAA